MTKSNTNGNGNHKREYVTPEGTVLHLRPISSYTITQQQLATARKRPVPPTITTYFNNDPNMPMEESNENDPTYKHNLSVWSQEANNSAMELFVKLGVTDETPSEFLEFYREMYPELSEKEVKIHWVYSLIGTSEDEITKFSQYVSGQTVPTEKGLEQAKETFPSND